MFKYAALAALLPVGLPAIAAVPAVTPVAAAPALPSTAGVERFYASRANAPLWFKTGAGSAASDLVAILRRAQLDGLSGGPELAARAEAAIQRARSGNPADLAQAERTLSAAWALYVQALSKPAAGMEYGDSFVMPRTLPADAILERAAMAPSLQQHIQAISTVNPLYAQLREAAWADLQSGIEPARRMIVNLDRARALPSSGRYLIVDIAAQRLLMMQDGQVQDSMKVIVGQPVAGKQTPLVASTIHYATFNPYWHVPPEMVRRIIAKNVLSQGEGYLRARGYQVVDGYTDNARVLGTGDVDWKAVAAGTQQVWVRQLPGKGNSMGAMKFNFPNETGIYLHDTPQKELFAKADRTLSAGCIRLEDARRLGQWLLGREPVAPTSAPEQHVALPKGVPVYVTYLTAKPEGGRLAFAPDIYGLDNQGMAGIATGN